MNKKIILLIALVLIIGIGFAGFKWLNKPDKEKEEIPVKKKVENINLLPLEQRPYVIIEPKSKTRPQDYGYWMTLSIYNANSYKGVDYDVEYQAGTLIQGFRHSLDFAKEEPPYSKESFFGSESKGKYYYHENMIGGSVVLQFFKEDESVDALKTTFNIQNMEEKGGVFTSNDVKATLEVDEDDFDSRYWVIIASTLGLPEPVEGKVLSEPYGFYAHKAFDLSDAKLTIKSNEDLTNAKILGWDGEEWIEYETEISGSSATALVDMFGTFVLVGE